MTNDVNVEMSTRIKEIREEHGLSQRAFAKEIGISGPSVANIENVSVIAIKTAKVLIFFRISDIFGPGALPRT